MERFLLITIGDIEPQLEGPFATSNEQVAVAKKHRFADPGLKDGLYYIDIDIIDGKPVPAVSEYRGPDSEREELYVIASDSELGYWSNKDGWVYSIADAERYHEAEKGVALPVTRGGDARFLRLDAADDYQPDMQEEA